MTIEEEFNNFGYDTPKAPCEICGETPTKLEPRFNYHVCIKHFHIPPVLIKEKKDELGKI